MERHDRSGKRDEAILAHIRAGQRHSEQAQGCFLAALDLLSQEYRHRVYSVCQSNLPQEEAEEVTVQIMHAAYEAMPDFRGDSSIKVWLWGIAKNKRADFWRKIFAQNRKSITGTKDDNRSQNRQDILIEIEQLQDTEDMNADQEEQWQLIQHCLRELPLGDRLIITLRHFGKLGAKEIADILLIKPDSLRRRYKRAIPRLKKKIQEAQLKKMCDTHDNA